MRSVVAPKPIDFGGLAVLASCWGSSFFFIELALESFGPLSVAAGRIAIAAALLTTLAVLAGHRLPRRRRDWGYLIGAGAVGAAMPFSLIPWGQAQIASSMAAILMAFTPLATTLLAHFMTHDERIAPVKLAGIGVGLAGVAVLVGGVSPETLAGNVPRKLAVLTAAIGYALSALLLRRTSGLPILVSAAGVMLSASLMSLPAALILEAPLATAPSWESLLAVGVLGVFPSAVAVVVLVWLLGRVGATFVSLNNYLVPGVGSVLGVTVLGERFTLGAAVGMGLILLGVLLTQHAQRRQARRLQE